MTDNLTPQSRERIRKIATRLQNGNLTERDKKIVDLGRRVEKMTENGATFDNSPELRKILKQQYSLIRKAMEGDSE